MFQVRIKNKYFLQKQLERKIYLLYFTHVMKKTTNCISNFLLLFVIICK